MPHARYPKEADMYLAATNLLAQGRDGNDAFLGIGVAAWIVIIAIVLVVAYFLSRGRGRRGL
jgi:hypothetical protein